MVFRPSRRPLVLGLFGLLFLVTITLSAVFGAISPGDPPDADLRNGRVFIQDNLWSTDSEQYAVWVATDGTPFVGKRHRGANKWSVVNLARLPGNPLGAPTTDDEHNVYAIAVDSLGFVHVMGNMHSTALRYIRSSAPADITQWQAAEVAGPDSRVTYPRIVGLPDGTLLFWRREGEAAQGSILLDALHAGERSWRHVGTVLAGDLTNEGPYLHQVAVDPRSGTLHILFEWRGQGGERSINDVGYARSADGGRSWETSARRPVALPMTHETAETVIDTVLVGSGLHNSGGLTVDAEGRPHGVVVFHPAGARRSIERVWFDGSSWQRQRLDGSALEGRPAVAATPGGRVWLLGVKARHITAVDVTSRPVHARRRLARVPAGWEVSYDSQALIRHGRLEMLVPDGRRPRVVSLPG